MRTASCFDRTDSVGGESAVAGEEFGVFAGEDVVGYGAEGVAAAEVTGEGEH